MLATARVRGKSYVQITAWSSLALLLAVSGCGTSAYEERLEATVGALRAGPPAARSGEAAEPPAAPAGLPVDDPVPGQEAVEAAGAANAAGQGGVVGRTILAPTDVLP
ncbi:MAG: hypothetical protein KF708_00195 [Pirellulales bacterium]|nr:hypothetical protein [Pirellulales bacterium]